MDAGNPYPHPLPPKLQQPMTRESETPVKAKNQQGADNASTPKRRGRNAHGRRQQQQQQAQPAPAWDSAAVTNPNDGYFDAEGRFVNGQSPDSASSGEGSPSPNKSKQGQIKRQARQNKIDMSDEGNSSSANPTARAINVGPARPPAASPAKQAAYAGPTFHASPAASALPMPSFFSKSLPNTATSSQTSLQARLDQETNGADNSGAESPTKPLGIATPSIPPREESPLDIFFKADREEKAKRAAGSPGPATPNGKPPKPPLHPAQSAPPQANSWNEIYGNSYRHHSRTASHDSQRGVFPLELDGTSVQPIQPPSHPLHNTTNSHDGQRHPLRNFLNAAADTGSTSPQLLPGPNNYFAGYSSDSQEASPFYKHQAPQVRSSSGPSTPSPYAQHQHHHHHPNNNSFHYGNRNLSPLFKAASNQPQTRSSSSLRRELTSSPAAGSVELPAFNTPPPVPSSQAPPPPSAVGRSRSYGGHGPSDAAARTATPDVKSMEDDLRRMLKITAFGGSDAKA